MTAVDLRNGRVIWTRPFGTGADTGPLGIRSHVPFTMGVPFSGGGITTRGGLAFIAASVEQAIRAYDVSSGKELWKARLPAGGQATPMTYRAPSGRQFVVIATGGKPTLKTAPGTKLVAYALPNVSAARLSDRSSVPPLRDNVRPRWGLRRRPYRSVGDPHW